MGNESVGTLVAINKAAFGRAVKDLFRQHAPKKSEPVDYQAYFSCLSPELLAFYAGRTEIKSSDMDELRETRRGLTRIVYASLWSLSFAAMNLVAFHRMRNSVGAFKAKLEKYLSGQDKYIKCSWEKEDEKKALVLFRSLEANLKASEEILDDLSSFPANLQACRKFSDLCNQCDKDICDHQKSARLVGFDTEGLMGLYAEYGCSIQGGNFKDFDAITGLFTYRRCRYGPQGIFGENLIDHISDDGINIGNTKIRLLNKYQPPAEFQPYFRAKLPAVERVTRPAAITINSDGKPSAHYQMIRNMFDGLADGYSPVVMAPDRTRILFYCHKDQLTSSEPIQMLEQMSKTPE